MRSPTQHSPGNILLIDEIHTPDSSRYWIADTYEQRHAEASEAMGSGGCPNVSSSRLRPAPCGNGSISCVCPAAFVPALHLLNLTLPACCTCLTARCCAALLLQGQEPQNIDKEFLRLWFRANCDPYNDPVLPEAPAELRSELSRRYVLLYERITGQQFQPAPLGQDPAERMRANVASALEAL